MVYTKPLSVQRKQNRTKAISGDNYIPVRGRLNGGVGINGFGGAGIGIATVVVVLVVAVVKEQVVVDVVPIDAEERGEERDHEIVPVVADDHDHADQYHRGQHGGQQYGVHDQIFDLARGVVPARGQPKESVAEHVQRVEKTLPHFRVTNHEQQFKRAHHRHGGYNRA